MPPVASTNAPLRSRSAPVNAPRTWPNRCESIRLSAIALQSTTTNGPRARGERVVDRARRELLAGARLALDQHGRVGRRRHLEHGEQLAHRDALARPSRRSDRARSAAATACRPRGCARRSPPNCTVAPEGTTTSPTRVPCHQVPLVEPRSLTRMPVGRRSRARRVGATPADRRARGRTSRARRPSSDARRARPRAVTRSPLVTRHRQERTAVRPRAPALASPVTSSVWRSAVTIGTQDSAPPVLPSSGGQARSPRALRRRRMQRRSFGTCPVRGAGGLPGPGRLGRARGPGQRGHRLRRGRARQRERAGPGRRPGGGGAGQRRRRRGGAVRHPAHRHEAVRRARAERERPAGRRRLHRGRHHRGGPGDRHRGQAGADHERTRSRPAPARCPPR